MASYFLSPFNGNVVSIVEAQRESRIARLLGEFEACRLKLRKLRQTPEMAALLDSCILPFTGEKQKALDDIVAAFSERGSRSPQSRKPKIEKTGKATGISKKTEKATSIYKIAAFARRAENRNNEIISPTVLKHNLETCTADQAQQNRQMRMQECIRGSQTRPSTREKIPLQSSHYDPDVSKIRIVRVESLSGCGTNEACANGTIQAPITSPSSLMYRTAPLPPHLFCPSETRAQFSSLRHVSSAQSPFNRIPAPPSPSLNKTAVAYEQPRPVPPLIRYSATPLQGHWLSNSFTQQTTSYNVMVPTPLRYAAFPFISQTNTEHRRWSANSYASTPPQKPETGQSSYAYAPTQTNVRKRGMDTTKSNELPIKMVSYGSVCAPSYENQLYIARQVSSLAKRPRYTTSAVF